MIDEKVKLETGRDEIRNSKFEIRNSQTIIFDDVSKFYGEILGVNRINLEIARGITSLVVPFGYLFVFLGFSGLVATNRPSGNGFLAAR